jgi:diguanylate cyclase (GGDEF)-like protein
MNSNAEAVRVDPESHEVDLSNCTTEPIRTPGSIQPHGVLVVARQSDLRVVYVSANAERFSRIPAEVMLGRSLLDCLSAEICAEIVHYDNDGQLVFNLPRTQALASGIGTRHHFDVRHYKDLVYVEIELEIVEPETERLPVRAQMAIDSVRSANSAAELLMLTAMGLRKLTGYDRVMVYQFAKDGHGYVVAEDRAEGVVPYLNLHFPASDVPAQAKQLYLLQRISVIANSRYEAVQVLRDPALGAEEPPLDMTYCGLRSVSPIHLEYVRNMGVGATLTLSLMMNDQLWGLIICHHRAPRLPSPELRSICELLSQIVSTLIREREECDSATERLQQQKAMEQIDEAFEGKASVLDCMVAAQKQVLEVVGANGALLRLDGEARCIGTTPTVDEAQELMTKLRAVEGDKIVCSNCVAELVPAAGALRKSASGVLMMSSLRNPGDGILWFRPELSETVMWGGNPDKSAQLNATTGHISARKSFERWKTSVEGTSRPWNERDIEAAISLKRTIITHLLRQAESALSISSLVDNITNLPNRRSFQEKLRAWSKRLDRCSASVILICIDRFKLVNAALGHSAGDDLMLQVARRLTALMEGEDILLARLSGDEFATLSSNGTAQETETLSARISVALHAPFQVLGKPFRITATLGLVHTSDGTEEHLLRAADTALHFAKGSAKRYMSFDRLLQDVATQGIEIEQDMHAALENGEFRLVYQPIVTLPEAEVVGFEALIRWHHPTKGIISPLDFIPVAEETGLIVPIGEWVLTEALQSICKWRRASGRPLRMNVNVSPQQLVTPGFAGVVEKSLSEVNLAADALSIEVTESTLMRDVAVDALHEIRRLGVSVSMDDFGTGYSSLANLRHLPVDTVKIDRGFVQPMIGDGKSDDFVEVILSLTKKLGLTAIAEGVETGAQRQALSAMGCRLAQGYLFSKPISPDNVSALIYRCKDATWSLLGDCDS